MGRIPRSPGDMCLLRLARLQRFAIYLVGYLAGRCVEAAYGTLIVGTFVAQFLATKLDVEFSSWDRRILR